ncbi:hypothetical protein CXF68_17295 [Tenacibaculum sp. Bg11-29]|uniref:leucine-rich repeat domain-containing protein n=1 Tax=Tenacibaculum sp. Bg11-29 TaxID=2058306 RepID=UPI000C334301|nr:hypothetical protein [Tenacibaculum sp. Bg11-29]PKH52342.1 hypothetical protein CXF68_17295 [Tenacibaculum sp. Bg11-29]
MKKQIFFVSVFLCFFFTSYSQNIDFIDPVFKNHLLSLPCNANGDGEITVQEAQNVGDLRFFRVEISDLTGIEHFVNLQSLHISFSKLKNINLSQNKKINFLRIESNPLLTNINLSQNNLLEDALLNFNNLTSIDVTNNTSLKYLGLINNKIASLNVSNNKRLEGLNVSGNLLTHIDIRNSAIKRLNFSNNPNIKKALLTDNVFSPLELNPGVTLPTFMSVNYSYCPKLEFICVDPVYVQEVENRKTATNYFGNYIVSTNCNVTSTCQIINFPDANLKTALLATSPAIDTDGDGEICIEEAEKLTNLSLHNKNINDASGIEYFKNLKLLFLSQNNLTSLNFTNNTKLEQLFIFHNNLTSLNIINNTKLEILHVNDNNLTNLNIDSNLSLKRLDATNNQLSVIDISNNVNLESLYLTNNKLKKLDITNNNSKLSEITISNNLISEIDIRNCLSASIDVNNNPNLEKTFLTGNHKFINTVFQGNLNFTYLGLSNCPKLNFICIDPSALNKMKQYTDNTLKLLNCTVSSNCTPTVPKFNDLLILSPNPTSSFLTLRPRDPSINGNAVVTVFKISGEIVKRVLVKFTSNTPEDEEISTPSNQSSEAPGADSGSVLVDVRDIPAGQYFLSVRNNLKLVTTQFIKL